MSEVYALTHHHETLSFQRVPAAQAEMIEAILLALAEEWRAAYHDYQADEALELVAWLHVAGRRYTAMPAPLAGWAPTTGSPSSRLLSLPSRRAERSWRSRCSEPPTGPAGTATTSVTAASRSPASVSPTTTRSSAS